MKQQKSLATSTKSNIKRKSIIISCAILGLIGTTLAIALPLTLCNSNNKQIPVDDGRVTLCETDKMVTSKLYHPETPVEFLVMSPTHENIANAQFRYSYIKTDDTSGKNPATFIDIQTTYNSSTNTWSITVTPIMNADQVIRGKFNFWVDCGQHRSNEISSEYWSIPNPVEVGNARICIRDDIDAKRAIDYLTNPDVAPFDNNVQTTYNDRILNSKLTFPDLINCLLGSDKCPFDFTSSELAQTNVSPIAPQINASVLIPAPVYRATTGPGGGLNAVYGLARQTAYWTNDQMWVDFVYGASWNVLVGKARYVYLDFKNNVSPQHHLDLTFDNLPTMTLDHWIGSMDNSQEIIETLPIKRGMNPFDETTHGTLLNPISSNNKSVGVWGEDLEILLYNLLIKYGYSFGGDFTPETPSGFNGVINLGATVDTYIYFSSIIGGFSLNSWGSQDFYNKTTDFIPSGLSVVAEWTEKFWMPSYWFHEYDRLGQGKTPMLYPTFIDGDV